MKNEIDVQGILARYGLFTQKSLGQNFLKDQRVLQEIALFAGSGRNILEIGAGIGSLTRLLAKDAKRVVTVEIDRRLEGMLSQEVQEKNHTFLWEDFLRCDLSKIAKEQFGGEPFTVVGNLPYYITTEILLKLFEALPLWERAVVMVQKEVADRLLCEKGSKEYRALSVITQTYCEGAKRLEVAPHSFVPAPHVHSAVMVLEPKESYPDKGYISFVQSGFAARRKMLASSPAFLNRAGLQKEELRALLKQANLEENARGESFSPSDWNRVYELAQNKRAEMKKV